MVGGQSSLNDTELFELISIHFFITFFSRMFAMNVSISRVVSFPSSLGRPVIGSLLILSE